jgi:hypothetical protein
MGITEAVMYADGLLKPKRQRRLSPAPGSAKQPQYIISYSELQNIHALVGWVCGSHMNLPTAMKDAAQTVARTKWRLASGIDEQQMRETQRMIQRVLKDLSPND